MILFSNNHVSNLVFTIFTCRQNLLHIPKLTGIQNVDMTDSIHYNKKT